jgi:cellulose synthase/poly-beta-1,6-N-acetylglucosamine synthase-like glycosyltransferase
MTSLLQWVFTAAFAALFWIYVGYPATVMALSRILGQRHSPDDRHHPAVSLLIMTYNEESVIALKLENSLLIDYPKEKLEIVVVDSASTDATARIALSFASRGIRLVQQPKRAGKASAIDFGIQHSTGEIAIVTDANAMVDPSAVGYIVRHFSDPRIGGVTGAMQQRDQSGTAESAAGDLYWKVEKVVRTAESRLHSVIGMSGEVSAYRRNLFLRNGQPVQWYTPGGPDDLDQTIYMVKHGYRVLYEPHAVVWEPAPDSAADIADQKIRVITMTIATVRHQFWSLLNWRYGWYGMFIFPSRKMLPLLSPLLYIAALTTSAVLVGMSTWWLTISIPLALVAIIGSIGFLERRTRRLAVVRLTSFFVALNAYVIRAWLQYWSGRRYTIWEKVQSTRTALTR